MLNSCARYSSPEGAVGPAMQSETSSCKVGSAEVMLDLVMNLVIEIRVHGRIRSKLFETCSQELSFFLQVVQGVGQASLPEPGLAANSISLIAYRYPPDLTALGSATHPSQC